MAGEWILTSLGEICDFRNGKAIAPERYDELGQHPVFGANGQIARSDDVLNPEPVIAIGRVGAYCGSVHYISMPSWVTDNAIVAIPKPGNDLRFLYYLFAQLDLRRTAIGSAQPLMTQGGLKVVETTVPPLCEQQAIARVLGARDDKIELNRRMNETLEAMARAIFKSWFVDFDPVRAKLALSGAEGMRGEQPAGLAPEIAALFPDALVETELGEAPEGWRTGSFLDVADLLSGGTPSTANSAYWNGDIPWVSAKDVSGAKGSFLLNTEKAITQLGVQNSSTKILPAHTTIITARGTVGSYCLLGSDMAMNQTNYGLRAKRDVGDFFVFFSTAQLIEHLQQQAYGTIFDTITTKTFRDTVTVQPPQPLLGEFEAMAEPIMMRVLAKANKEAPCQPKRWSR